MNEKTYRITLWTSVVGAIVLTIGGIVALAYYSEKQDDSVPAPGVTEITAGDHVFGKADAAVTIVEYADFQCPACAAYYPMLKQAKAEYGDRARFVFRNYPLPQHPNARVAAYAAEAASLQGKFWEMHDLIFENQEKWSGQNATEARKTFDGYAESLALDMQKFGDDRASDAVRTKVDSDVKSGNKAGVSSTPTFYLNGKKIEPRSYDDFKRALDAALITP